MDDVDLFSVFGGDEQSSKPEKRKAQSSGGDAKRVEREEWMTDVGDGRKRIVHEEVLPDVGEPQAPWIPHNEPAKKYEFELDPFQRKSIECLEKGESVLVAAHTSAGKTVVAEYAIAMALREKQRVIYTSPIKALSNQKYRDLQKEFGDVGLMTGDVTICPNASCLVMTTEILRNMLYRGNEILREVAWVIFDEIHYMRDLERGVVWEESIIMLPDKVRFVFLSATIPNGREFAGWIATVHQQKLHVIYTEYRPTPLNYYVYPSGADGLYLVMDESGQFRDKTFESAISILGQDALDSQVNSKAKNSKATTRSNLRQIITVVMEHHFEPAIVFSFSKKACEAYGNVISQDCFTNESEREMIKLIYNSAIEELSEEDKRLPQINSILPLLLNGIAIHHGGLLPILKEITELLFQEGLIKILFATETFAMGVNMPAKTVIFTEMKKFDGKDIRLLTSGEYIQMSGRAGRRGKDTNGIVIQMVDEKVDPVAFKSILNGQADPLNSSFYLGYNMLLNLLRVEGANPETLIKNSFYQYQQQQKAPQMENEIKQLEERLKSLPIDREDKISEHYMLVSQCQNHKKTIQRVMTSSPLIYGFLKPGCLIRLQTDEGVTEWGCLLSWNLDKSLSSHMSNPNDGRSCILSCALLCKSDEGEEELLCLEGELSQCRRLVLRKALLPTLYELSAVKMTKLPPSIKTDSSMFEMRKAIGKALACYHNDLPLLDPIANMKITDTELREAWNRLESVNHSLSAFGPIDVNSISYKNYKEKISIQNQIHQLRLDLRAASTMSLSKELGCMKRVLSRLGYIDDRGVITIKGKMICEINSRDELLLTELIFDNVFADLNVPQTCALLSIMCYSEKATGIPIVPSDMRVPIQRLQTCARVVAEKQKDAGIELDVDEYVDGFKPYFVDVMYAWACGESFAEAMKRGNDVFEGTLIRVIRSLDELLRQLSDAAHAIGNIEMEKQFTACTDAIKRDIVFAASLYLNQ